MILAHLQHARGEIEANKVPDTAGFIKPYKCTEFRQGFMKWALAENLSDLRSWRRFHFKPYYFVGLHKQNSVSASSAGDDDKWWLIYGGELESEMLPEWSHAATEFLVT